MLPICEKELNKARKKFDELEKLVLECNTLSVDKIYKFERYVEELSNLCPGKHLQVLVDDTNYVRADFVNNCICKRAKQRIK